MVAIKNMFTIVRVGLAATVSVVAAYYTLKRFQNKKKIESGRRSGKQYRNSFAHIKSSHQDAQSYNSMSLSGNLFLTHAIGNKLPVVEEEEVERVNNSSNNGHKLVAQNVNTIKEHKELEEEEEAKRVNNSSINGHKLAAQNANTIKEQEYPAVEEEEEFERVNNSSINGHKLVAQNVKAIKEQEEKERFILANRHSNGPLSEQPTQPAKINNIHIKLTEVHKGSSRVAKLPPIPSPPSNHTPAKAICGKPTPFHQHPLTSALPPPPPPPSGMFKDQEKKSEKLQIVLGAPPPPPPTPPSGMFKDQGKKSENLQIARELIEFHHLLIKRKVKKESAKLRSATTNMTGAQSNLIAEIEKRSSFLRLVKDDVEAQGELVQSLARRVRAAAYIKIEDIVSFVKWLDEELSILVDERAVLKHFDWPEIKVDALREAAFEYQDLKNLETKVTSFVDDKKLPCDAASKMMYCVLEKIEKSVDALLCTRDTAIARYKKFGIPFDWLLDTGVVGKIKLASLKLATTYMKRIASELNNTMHVQEKESVRDFILLECVKFALRVHQFAGGFDMECMQAFEKLRGCALAHVERIDNLSSKS